MTTSTAIPIAMPNSIVESVSGLQRLHSEFGHTPTTLRRPQEATGRAFRGTPGGFLSVMEILRQLTLLVGNRVETELDRERHCANPQSLGIGRRTLHRTRI